MPALCAALDELAPGEIKTAVQIAIDTGRRPEEIMSLPLDCLTRDAGGAPVLIYDNLKRDREGRRLPVSEHTAAVIAAQQQRVTGRSPPPPPTGPAPLPTPPPHPLRSRTH